MTLVALRIDAPTLFVLVDEEKEFEEEAREEEEPDRVRLFDFESLHADVCEN